MFSKIIKSICSWWNYFSTIPLACNENGWQEWYQNEKLHRIDGPAIIWPNGYQGWWQNGQWHRLYGPARIWPDGRKEWWINGKFIKEYNPKIPKSDWFKEGF